jgi:pantoate--beta-alanine ligase
MVKTVRKISDLRREITAARAKGRRVGLVPTMGALHEGHLELVRQARSECDLVVASVFVNPRQFGPGEDFERYPRDLRRDSRLLAGAGCDLVFAPSAEEMYPPGARTTVTVEGLSEVLCGQTRPGHFAGVALVVLKLFNAATPDRAYFGEKDFQQLVVLKRMVRDLDCTVRVVAVPTVREKDGLAMSSRNAYLTAGDRAVATALFRALELARLMAAGGERRAEALKGRMMSLLLDAGVTKVDYVAVVDPETLAPVLYLDREVRVLVAGWVGATRLIDNAAVAPAARRPGKAIRHDTVCVVLAAGEGKRMKSRLPKVLHTVAGRPIVAHVVGAAKAAGAGAVIVIVGHGAARVAGAVRRLGAETLTQDVQRGTGHAVLQTLPLLVGFRGDVLILSGDTPLVTAETIRRVLEAHRSHGSTVTFATARVPDPGGYGRIVRDSRGGFQRIVEERDADPATRRITEINGGLYCFKAAALFESLVLVTADNAQQEYYLPKAIDVAKARGGSAEAVLIDDRDMLAGVNTPEELDFVRERYRSRR